MFLKTSMSQLSPIRKRTASSLSPRMVPRKGTRKSETATCRTTAWPTQLLVCARHLGHASPRRRIHSRGSGNRRRQWYRDTTRPSRKVLLVAWSTIAPALRFHLAQKFAAALPLKRLAYDSTVALVLRLDCPPVLLQAILCACYFMPRHRPERPSHDRRADPAVGCPFVSLLDGIQR
jgi:hypothetical protein